MNARHLLWIPAAGLLSWATAFLFGDLIALPVDLYYLIYFSIVLAFVAAYVRITGVDLARWVRRRIAWAVPLGILGGVALMAAVLARPATPPLEGAGLVWALAYRGVLYGAVDGILLFAFPWLVAWRALDAEGGTRRMRAAAAAVALGGTLLITTTYHLGYRDFRSQKIVMPNIGSVIGGVPTLVAANPAASVISHAMMHVTSVIHSPDSDLFLPPHRP